MRYAVYFTPPQDDPLTRAAASWLGRDAFGGHALPEGKPDGFSSQEFAYNTAEPRRYGFHATIVAPFALNPAKTDESLIEAFDRFCMAWSRFGARLEVTSILSFVAIMEAERSDTLNAMAAEAVEYFNPFLATLSDADIARRKPESLTSHQLVMLQRWGYPYVMDEFRFHMTLSSSLDEAARVRMKMAANARFDEFLAEPVEIGGLGLFVEHESGAPFTVLRHAHFTKTQERKTA